MNDITQVFVLTTRDRERLHDALLGAVKSLTTSVELITESWRSPSTWILGRPTPREMDCSFAAVPLSCARSDLSIAADILRGSAL